MPTTPSRSRMRAKQPGASDAPLPRAIKILIWLYALTTIIWVISILTGGQTSL